MKKIINKIKQNENLCKVLKVLKLVLDLVVYGFAIFMIIGLAIGQSHVHNDAKAQERQLIPNVATTPIKQAYREDGISTMSYSEMATPAFYYSIIDTMKQSEIDSDWVALGGTARITNPNDVWSSYIDSNGDIQNTGGIRLIEMIYDRSLDDYWELTIYFYYDFNGFYTGVFFKIYNGDTQTPLFNTYVHYPSFIINNNYNNLVSWSFNSNLTNYFEIPSTYDNGYTGGYYQGMKEGKAEGYTNGYDVGYNSGYNVGYTAGYEGGGLKSPFDMISQAFSSIASILNIQLIPGLTLGVLVFTPVLISIIIVVVRMIKG